MADFNETKTPLTLKNVQAWARATFNTSFKALPRAATLRWIKMEDSFVISRAVWRSLGRSAHKQLLVIGGYAPGPEVDEPSDIVTAHVHADEETAVSFYRITKNATGKNELIPVHATNTVAFHAPFCELGDDTGDSKAIHRVSALISYYFLAAGHVKELFRTRSGPSMFARGFRDACSWVGNDGERPGLPSRRSSGATSVSQEPATVRPKRSSTTRTCGDTIRPRIARNRLTPVTASTAQLNAAEAAHAPPMKRSATDSLSMKIKRERDEDSPAPPKKHPRRTLSEQITIPRLPEAIMSPRSPAPERVNRALTDRIQHLKDENLGLKDNIREIETEKSGLQKRVNKDARNYNTLKTEMERTKQELHDVKSRLSEVEEVAKNLRLEVAGLQERLQRAEKDAGSENTELDTQSGVSKDLTRS